MTCASAYERQRPTAKTNSRLEFNSPVQQLTMAAIYCSARRLSRAVTEA